VDDHKEEGEGAHEDCEPEAVKLIPREIVEHAVRLEVHVHDDIWNDSVILEETRLQRHRVEGGPVVSRVHGEVCVVDKDGGEADEGEEAS